MEREQNFTEFGQRLKVEKIITGHHPTSQRTTVAPKRDVRVGKGSLHVEAVQARIFKIANRE